MWLYLLDFAFCNQYTIRDLIIKNTESLCGTCIVEQLSLDLRGEFPQEKGFSACNLWYMKQWYEYYTREPQFLQRIVAEMFVAFVCVLRDRI